MKTISYSEMLKMLNAQDLMSKKDKELVSLREQLASASSELTKLSVSTLNAVQCMSGGKSKADLRDAYDKASNFLEKLEGKG
jgi:hypothetical protein